MPGRNGNARHNGPMPTVNPALARDLAPKQKPPATPEEACALHPAPDVFALNACQQMSGLLAQDEAETSMVLASLPLEAPERAEIIAAQTRIAAARRTIMALYLRTYRLSVAKRGLGPENLAILERIVVAAEAECAKRAQKPQDAPATSEATPDPAVPTFAPTLPQTPEVPT